MSIDTAFVTHDVTKAALVRFNTEINALIGGLDAKLDLLAVHKNARDLWAKMDNEMIECRKRGRLTARYQQLKLEIDIIFKIIDKELFWVKLH
jgi:hypothetical protein